MGVVSSRLACVMWVFCLRSLVREYGWLFIRRVAARHPWRTLRALRAAGRIDAAPRGAVDVGGGTSDFRADDPPSIVGAGFCLKPLSPACPSGRPNHDCYCLEALAGSDAAGVPSPCRACAIREIGMHALHAGSAFYVMTSARDILDDVYVPALEARQFETGVFVLCRYSFKPFAVGLLASGMRARMLPLELGDCRDYGTWLLADLGIKDEQTTVEHAVMAGVASVLCGGASAQARRFQRRGNVLHPVAAGPAARRPSRLS